MWNKLKNFLKLKIKPMHVLWLKKLIKSIQLLLFYILDFLFAPITLLYSFFLKAIRKRKFEGLPISKKILLTVGVFPIIDHYYEPLFNTKYLRKSLREDRNLPGINFNIEEQLELLKKFNFNNELLLIPTVKREGVLEFCHNIGPFPPADAEFLYNIIRLYKPNKIIEIGSGHSTLMAINALKMNKIENPEYTYSHVCIEPYEIGWLEKLNVNVIREPVENTDISLFESLTANDILFIDSTHMIRPQGDVLFEFLEILPVLKSGVLIHIHDVFTPEDYPNEWIKNAVFWNEQYLLEAFMSCNNDFRIIGAVNFLKKNYYAQLAEKSPLTKIMTEKGELVGAGSFWLIKN